MKITTTTIETDMQEIKELIKMADPKANVLDDLLKLQNLMKVDDDEFEEVVD